MSCLESESVTLRYFPMAEPTPRTRRRPRWGPHCLLAAAALSIVGCGEGPAPGPPGPAVADPESAAAILEASQVHLREGEPGRAIAVLASAVEQYPDDADLRRAFGTMLLHEERHAEAYEQYRVALGLAEPTAEEAFAAGTLAAVVGDHAAAAEHLALAVELAPSNTEYLTRLGQSRMEAGDHEGAEEALARAITLDDGDAIAWGSLAEAAMRVGDHETALERIRTARAIDPDLLAWKALEARARRATGDVPGAMALLETIGVPARYEPGFIDQLAACYGALGRPGDAAALYRQAAEWHPDRPDLAEQAAAWEARATEGP